MKHPLLATGCNIFSN